MADGERTEKKGTAEVDHFRALQKRQRLRQTSRRTAFYSSRSSSVSIDKPIPAAAESTSSAGAIII